MIINWQGEQIGLLVDAVGDIVKVNQKEIESAPATIGKIRGHFFIGIIKTDDQLIAILDINQILNPEWS